MCSMQNTAYSKTHSELTPNPMSLLESEVYHHYYQEKLFHCGRVSSYLGSLLVVFLNSLEDL